MPGKLLSLGLAVGLFAETLGTAYAFVEDTPPTFANGSVDPNRTTDPAAVAAAQKALSDFFDHTNLSYSMAGYTNPRVMREDIGNTQSDWLDKTMPLACGRLVNGWKAMNWVPGKGWSHGAAGAASGPSTAGVSCLYTPPTIGNNGADPNQTIDPAAVGAAQKALGDFYTYTNLSYSNAGYSNPQVMREVIGNTTDDWMDQALNLARGRLVGGWKFMNWVPGKGWCHCAAPRASGAEFHSWAAQVPHDSVSLPRTVASRLDSARSDPQAKTVLDGAERIKSSLAVALGGD